MITVIYDPINGTVVPDGKINDWIDEVVALDADVTVTIGAETMLHELRARHCEGKLKIAETLTFKDNGSDNPADWVLVQIDKDGRIDYWPRGFCDHTDKALARLLGFGEKWADGCNRAG